MLEVAVYRVDYGRRSKIPLILSLRSEKQKGEQLPRPVVVGTEVLRVGFGGRPPYRHRREACPGSNLPGSARKFRRDHFFSKAWR